MTSSAVACLCLLAGLRRKQLTQWCSTGHKYTNGKGSGSFYFKFFPIISRYFSYLRAVIKGAEVMTTGQTNGGDNGLPITVSKDRNTCLPCPDGSECDHTDRSWQQPTSAERLKRTRSCPTLFFFFCFFFFTRSVHIRMYTSICFVPASYLRSITNLV